jgi:hypothetical protein
MPTSSQKSLVMKFGGTSVANLDRIRNVALHVKREVEAGYHVAVVGMANYQIFDSEGQPVLMRDGKTPKTAPNNTWDRCWVVAELAMRDIATEKFGKSKTIFILEENQISVLNRFIIIV